MVQLQNEQASTESGAEAAISESRPRECSEEDVERLWGDLQAGLQSDTKSNGQARLIEALETIPDKEVAWNYRQVAIRGLRARWQASKLNEVPALRALDMIMGDRDPSVCLIDEGLKRRYTAQREKYEYVKAFGLFVKAVDRDVTFLDGQLVRHGTLPGSAADSDAVISAARGLRELPLDKRIQGIAGLGPAVIAQFLTETLQDDAEGADLLSKNQSWYPSHKRYLLDDGRRLGAALPELSYEAALKIFQDSHPRNALAGFGLEEHLAGVTGHIMNILTGADRGLLDRARRLETATGIFSAAAWYWLEGLCPEEAPPAS